MVIAGDEKASFRKLKLCPSDRVQKDLQPWQIEVKAQMGKPKSDFEEQVGVSEQAWTLQPGRETEGKI